MRTLFLHPTDPSTEFGDLIYQDYLMKLNDLWHLPQVA